MKAQKKLTAAPAGTTAKNILDNGILAGQNSLSTKKGACERRKREENTQDTRVESIEGIIPAECSLSSSKIAKRRADMPRVYRGTYDKAMTGKSLRAAVNAFCLECVCWQREEVRLCPSTPCPRWLYRPYREDTVKTEKSSGFSKTPRQGPDSAPDSTNTLDS